MSKQREALEAALTEINVHLQPFGRPSAQTQVVINKINEALAEPEQKPFATLNVGGHESNWLDFQLITEPLPGFYNIYTSPQPREWQELGALKQFLVACVDDSMSRNNRQSLAAELLSAMNEVEHD